MLRASVRHTNGEVDLRAITNGRSVDAQLPLSDQLLDLADAAVNSVEHLPLAREQLRSAAGTAVMNDAAAVIANFEMMTRVADTTGAAVDVANEERLTPVIAAIGVADFETARWG
jgi:hypothetical protein